MPFENPNGLTNFVEMLAILAIPASLTFTYGRMVGSRRQGWTIFGAMFVLFAISVAVVYIAESHVTPAQNAAGLTGANLEGKEVRFGTAGSSLWTAVTTVTSCGAVNAAFESLTGIGGLVPMVNLAYGESVFGGVGTGLYTMLLYVLLAVFIGGLMVGRTPEYLGKKIEAREVKLVVLGLLFTPLAILVATSLATATKYGAPSIYASGPQGFSESLYAYMSQANNNGSAFAGYTGYYQPEPGNLGAHGITFADLLGGLTMLLARFIPIIFALAVAGVMLKKRVAPAGPRDDAHRHAHVRRPADRHGGADRRADLLPRPAPRPRGPGHDRSPLLSHETKPDHLRPRRRRLHGPPRARLSARRSPGSRRSRSAPRPTATTLIAQADSRARATAADHATPRADPRYFQPRPSQTDYNANGTFFSNRGPNQASARYFYRDQIAAYRSSTAVNPA